MAAARRVGLIVALVVLGGVVTGVLASLLILTLHGIGWLSFGSIGEPDVTGAAIGISAGAWGRRMVPPIVGGALAGLAWWWLRSTDNAPTVTSLIAATERGHPTVNQRRQWWSALADAATQILVVGTGASIGRENAPRLAAAGAMSDLARRARLRAGTSRVLIASAAGAGLAAVYNVPITGVLFTTTVTLAVPTTGAESDMRGARGRPSARRWLRVLGSGWSVTAVVVSVPMSFIATLIARFVIGSGPRLPLPPVTVETPQLMFVLVGGIAAGAIGSMFSVMARRARLRATRPGVALPVGIAVVGFAIGGVSLWLPVGGNGLGLVEPALIGAVALPVAAAYIVAKPLLTVAYLRAGAVGGLLMPALSTGGALGAAAAVLSGQPTAAFVMIAGVAALAASERAWLFAAALAWEMTQAPIALGACLAAAAIIGHTVSWLTERSLPQRLRGPISTPPASRIHGQTSQGTPSEP